MADQIHILDVNIQNDVFKIKLIWEAEGARIAATHVGGGALTTWGTGLGLAQMNHLQSRSMNFIKRFFFLFLYEGNLVVGAMGTKWLNI